MADPTRSASTYFSSGSEGAAERQFYGCTTVLELNDDDYQSVFYICTNRQKQLNV
jgi:hypothetical protein